MTVDSLKTAIIYIDKLHTANSSMWGLLRLTPTRGKGVAFPHAMGEPSDPLQTFQMRAKPSVVT